MPTILVCDNEEVIRSLVRASLDEDDYSIVEARDGEEAMARAREARPDLLILDMLMPGRNGLEVVAELRRDPELAQTAILMLTARAGPADRAAALDADADGFLAKPFSPRELASSVRDLLERSPRASSPRAPDSDASSESVLPAFVDQLPDPVFIVRADGALEQVNARFAEFAGTAAGDLVAGGWESLIHPDDVRDLLARLHGISGTSCELEARLRYRDGSYPRQLLRLRPLPDGTWIGAASSVAHEHLEEREALRQELGRATTERRIAELLCDAVSTAEALPAFLAALGEGLDWDVAVFWETDDARELIRRREVWVSPACGDVPSGPRELRLDAGLVGRAWARRQAVEGSEEQSEFGAALALPVTADGEVVGVVELLARKAVRLGAPLRHVLEAAVGRLGGLAERTEATARLRTGHAELRAISETDLVALATVDLDGRILVGNATLQGLLGYDEAALEGRSLAELAQEADREPVRQRLAGITKGTTERARLELKLRRAEGTPVDAILELALIRDPEGTPEHVIALVATVDDGTDVLEREQDRREELARTLAELATEKDRVESFYRFAQRLLVTQPDDLEQTALEELAGRASAEVAALYEVTEAGSELELVASRGLDPATLAQRLRVGEGALGRAFSVKRLLAVSYGDAPLPLGEQGITHAVHIPLVHGHRELGVVMLGRTGELSFSGVELEAIEALCDLFAAALAGALGLKTARRFANRARALLDAGGDGVRLFDLDGKEVLANSAMTRLEAELGLPRSGTLAERDRATAELTSDPEAFRAEAEALAQDPERVSRIELHLPGPDRRLERACAPARDLLDATIGRVIVLRDAAARQAPGESESDLIQTVAHELRTPLAGILGFVEILLDRDPGDERRRRYLETIRDEVVRLAAIASGLLEAHPLGAGTTPAEPFRLDDAIRRAALLSDGQSERHTVRARLPDGPLIALGDGASIMQVLMNLLANAIKYSPEGGVVTIGAERLGDRLRVAVEDEGIGISPDDRQRIFQKFGRARSAEAHGIEGLGLGLALSRKIVHAHGGELEVSSAEGRGSTFWFDLSAEREASAAALEQADTGS